MTLTEFLLARIAEDEAVARTCAEMFPPPWEVADRGWRVRIYSANVPDEGDHAEPGDERSPCVMEVEPARLHEDTLWLSERVEHVARWNPTRGLAECLAKRRAIDAAWADQVQIEGEWGSCRSRAEMEAINDCPVVVAALAEVYATHPDYDDTWPRYDTQGNGTT